MQKENKWQENIKEEKKKKGLELEKDNLQSLLKRNKRDQKLLSKEEPGTASGHLQGGGGSVGSSEKEEIVGIYVGKGRKQIWEENKEGEEVPALTLFKGELGCNNFKFKSKKEEGRRLEPIPGQSGARRI